MRTHGAIPTSPNGETQEGDGGGPEAIRFVLISAAAPADADALRFGADALPDGRGLAAIERGRARLPSRAMRWHGPDIRARLSAEALGVSGSAEAALRDMDFGAWNGLTIEGAAERDPALFAAWLGELGAAPPGGDTARAVLARVGAWLDERSPGTHVVVAAPIVIRAALVHALGAPEAWFHLNVAHGTRSEVSRFGGRIRVTMLNGAL